MEYMAAQMDRQIDGAISENERLSNELHEAHALNVALLDALIELEAMADRYRPPGYPIPDAQKKARAAIARAQSTTTVGREG